MQHSKATTVRICGILTKKTLQRPGLPDHQDSKTLRAGSETWWYLDNKPKPVPAIGYSLGCWRALPDRIIGGTASERDFTTSDIQASKTLSPKVRIQASKRGIFHETFTKSDNPSFQKEHFPRDFHQKRESKLPKRAFSTRLSPKVTIQASKRGIFHENFPRDFQSKLPKGAFSTRLSAKVTIQASKTSIFHETFTKSDNPSFQNECCPRDFSQKRTSGQTLCITNPNVTAPFKLNENTRIREN